jgi:hypothetical protein
MSHKPATRPPEGKSLADTSSLAVEGSERTGLYNQSSMFSWDAYYVMTPTIVRKSGKHRNRNPMESTGKYSLPRRGEKTKQTKVTPAKESETKGSRQTKLSFLTTGNDMSPPTPIGTTKPKAITPESCRTSVP